MLSLPIAGHESTYDRSSMRLVPRGTVMPQDTDDEDRSQAAMLRELVWTLAGCGAVVIAVNVLAGVLGHT